jgi:hypothetical protein
MKRIGVTPLRLENEKTACQDTQLGSKSTLACGFAHGATQSRVIHRANRKRGYWASDVIDY